MDDLAVCLRTWRDRLRPEDVGLPPSGRRRAPGVRREERARRPVARHVSDRKTLEHPEVGRITLDCDVLIVAGSDLRIIVYSAPPGSDDARALALIAITLSARDTASA